MSNLSSGTRQINNGAASWEDGYSTKLNAGQIAYINLIEKANSVTLQSVFDLCKIEINQENNKIRCPLPNHARDNTPSFFYYHDTNTFYCFGCKTGRLPVDFLANYKNISKQEAARLILSKIDSLANDTPKQSIDDYLKKKEILIEFSNMIRSVRSNNINDPKILDYVDKLCFSLDKLIDKYKNIDSCALSSIIEKINSRIEKIKG
jgi:hypothetical protein